MGLFKIGWWNTSLRPPRQRFAPSDRVLATAQTILDLFLEEQIDLLGLGAVPDPRAGQRESTAIKSIT